MRAVSTCVKLSLILGTTISEYLLVNLNTKANEVKRKMSKNDVDDTTVRRNISFLVYTNIQTTL